MPFDIKKYNKIKIKITKFITKFPFINTLIFKYALKIIIKNKPLSNLITEFNLKLIKNTKTQIQIKEIFKKLLIKKRLIFNRINNFKSKKYKKIYNFTSKLKYTDKYFYKLITNFNKIANIYSKLNLKLKKSLPILYKIFYINKTINISLLKKSIKNFIPKKYVCIFNTIKIIILTNIYTSFKFKPFISLCKKFNTYFKIYLNLKKIFFEENLKLIKSKINYNKNKFKTKIKHKALINVNKALINFDQNTNNKFNTYAMWWVNQIIYSVNNTNKITYKNQTEIEKLDHKNNNNKFIKKNNNKINKIILYTALKLLTEKELKIILKRFNKNIKKNEKTLKNIGKNLHLTKERIRQIELEAIKKIKNTNIIKIIK